MGRHSASGDEDESEARSAGTVAEVLARPGRHATPEDEAQPAEPVPVQAVRPEAVTEQIPAIGGPRPGPRPGAAPAASEQPAAVPGPAAQAAPAPEPSAGAAQVGKGSHATAADFNLIRKHADVRARCAAGLLVPIVLYTVVLVAIGSLRASTFLLWIWIPLVTAGVLVGQFLDSAHRRYDPGPGA